MAIKAVVVIVFILVTMWRGWAMTGLKGARMVLRQRLKRREAPRQTGNLADDGLAYPCDAGAAETWSPPVPCCLMVSVACCLRCNCSIISL